MANLATTTYKVTGTRKAVSDLWTALQHFNVNASYVWLNELADFYGINYKEKHISVRGKVYFAEYSENEKDGSCLLTFETETAWDATTELFEEINHMLWDELSISYRVCECGCEVYYVHDEGNFFPEQAVVSSSGNVFGEAFDDLYNTAADAIKEWCDKMHIEQGERTDEEMLNFINEYEYDDDDTYFYIRIFTFE